MCGLLKIFSSHFWRPFLCFQGIFFQKILFLCMGSIQERVMMARIPYVKGYTVSKNGTIPELSWHFQIHRVYKILVVLSLKSRLQNKQSEGKHRIWNKNLFKIRQFALKNRFKKLIFRTFKWHIRYHSFLYLVSQMVCLLPERNDKI